MWWCQDSGEFAEVKKNRRDICVTAALDNLRHYRLHCDARLVLLAEAEFSVCVLLQCFLLNLCLTAPPWWSQPLFLYIHYLCLWSFVKQRIVEFVLYILLDWVLLIVTGMYMDRRCVYYCKPLLESGTLGTKCNVQVCWALNRCSSLFSSSCCSCIWNKPVLLNYLHY